MSVCNFTQQVGANQCIGDSLVTFNTNFSALDQGLCEVPSVIAGLGTQIERSTSEQQKNFVSIGTTNNFVYNTKFDSFQIASEQNTQLLDGTSVKTTTFPYVAGTFDTKPLATFSTVCLTDKAPKVTLYWMASGVDNNTVYALNSAVSPTDKGPIWFNDTVNALHVDGNNLYVGGNFITVGGNVARKFCKIDLTGGLLVPSLSSVGSLSSIPFGVGGDLGASGSVDAIEVNDDFIVVGGSFFGGFKGRGLTIQQRSNGQSFPFYVNGDVRSVHINGNNLFVGGSFDYVNYGPTSASVISGLRLLSNGLIKIDLSTVTSNPIASLSDLSSLVFSGPSEVNAITSSSDKIFLGGAFQIKTGSTLVCQNLCSIDSNGTRLATWQPIINGPVHTLNVDDTTSDGGSIYLYVGGSFSKVYNSSEFNSTPRLSDSSVNYTNAVAYKILTTSLTIQSFWKPLFNGPIGAFAFHDVTTDSAVYCYGRFTEVNGQPQSYLAAVKKTSFAADSSSGETVLWNPSLQNGPKHLNSGLVKYRNTLIVGGNFAKVNDSVRYNLAMISDIDGGVTIAPLSGISWEFGCQVASSGMNFNMDLTNFASVSSYPLPFGRVNATSFPIDHEQFKGNSQGQLARFFIRRPGVTQDTLKNNVNVLGWKTDFN
jgi:hypothetical protein